MARLTVACSCPQDASHDDLPGGGSTWASFAPPAERFITGSEDTYRREPTAETQASKAPDAGASQGWSIKEEADEWTILEEEDEPYAVIIEEEEEEEDVEVRPPALSPLAGPALLSLLRCGNSAGLPTGWVEGEGCGCGGCCPFVGSLGARAWLCMAEVTCTASPTRELRAVPSCWSGALVGGAIHWVVFAACRATE